eukprot:354554-Chlamydomonas_euryale.AAC.7
MGLRDDIHGIRGEGGSRGRGEEGRGGGARTVRTQFPRPWTLGPGGGCRALWRAGKAVPPTNVGQNKGTRRALLATLKPPTPKKERFCAWGGQRASSRGLGAKRRYRTGQRSSRPISREGSVNLAMRKGPASARAGKSGPFEQRGGGAGCVGVEAPTPAAHLSGQALAIYRTSVLIGVTRRRASDQTCTSFQRVLSLIEGEERAVQGHLTTCWLTTSRLMSRPVCDACRRDFATPIGATSRSAQPLLLLRSGGGCGGGRRATTAERACCPPRGSRGLHCLLVTCSGCIAWLMWCLDIGLAQQMMARAFYNRSEACTAV